MYFRVGYGGGIVESRAAAALTYARLAGSDVVNMSWSGPGGGVLSAALADCYEDSIALVVSSGNLGTSPGHVVKYPANDPSTICVGGTTDEDEWWDQSCYVVGVNEAGVDLAAPAVDIVTTLTQLDESGVDCQYEHIYADGSSVEQMKFSGTSASAPMVTSAIALLMAKYPFEFKGYPERVRSRLTKSAQRVDVGIDYGATGQSEKLGFGRLNLYYALNYSEGGESTTDQTKPDTETVITCPGCSTDDLTIRMTILNEFGKLVANHPEDLAKAIAIGDVSGGTATINSPNVDPPLLAFYGSINFPYYSDFVYLQKEASADGHLDAEFDDPSGCGIVECIGHVIDSDAARFLEDPPGEYVESSAFHSSFQPDTLIFTTVDLDGDSDVDGDDSDLFVDAYGSQIGDPEYSMCANYDADLDVDLADWARFAAHYGH